jgi:hypothetical protein
MGPFIKTLFGDARNVAVVASLIVSEFVLVHAGFGREAALLVPFATMAGIAWLAAR